MVNALIGRSTHSGATLEVEDFVYPDALIQQVSSRSVCRACREQDVDNSDKRTSSSYVSAGIILVPITCLLLSDPVRSVKEGECLPQPWLRQVKRAASWLSGARITAGACIGVYCWTSLGIWHSRHCWSKAFSKHTQRYCRQIEETTLTPGSIFMTLFVFCFFKWHFWPDRSWKRHFWCQWRSLPR